MDLTTILFILSLPFVLLTVYFGTKNDFYESENYKGDGCAHDVKRWLSYELPLNTQVHLLSNCQTGLYISSVIFLPAILHVSKSFIRIEYNDGLVIPLTSGLAPGPCLYVPIINQ